MQVAACMHMENLQTMHFTIACARKNMYTRTVSQLLHSYFMHSYITRRGSRAAGQWLLRSFVHSNGHPISSWSADAWAKLSSKQKAWQGGASPALTKEAKTTYPKSYVQTLSAALSCPHARQATSLYCSMDTMEAQVLRWEQAARHMASIQQVISIWPAWWVSNELQWAECMSVAKKEACREWDCKIYELILK